MNNIKTKWNLFVNYFTHGNGSKLIKIYKNIKTKTTYLVLYGLIIVFLLQEAVAIIFGEKIISIANKLISEYKYNGHTKFWIETIANFFNSSNTTIAIIALCILIILFALNVLDKLFPATNLKFKILDRNSLLSNNTMLESSIQREKENNILNSLLNFDNKIIFIQGEEGIGKTILALQLLQKLPKEEYIVRFFKSHEWEDSESVSNLLLQDNSNTLDSVLSEESKNIVICLDGVNERSALKASIKILDSFSHLSEVVKTKIQIIFTTRDLSSYPLYQSNSWAQYQKFKLKKFTDKELKSAIVKIDPQYNFEDFPKELKSIASIPRYLHLAFQLKDKLGGYTNISKEILYWEGLKEQLKNDPKIREQGFTETSDIESVLLEICESITIKNDKAIINQKSFKEYFGDDYRKVKTPFIESRMVTSSDNNKIELNFDMVVIGYAVYILTLFDEIDTSSSVEEIADFFKEKLEPYVNDNMSKVPFIVFQLSLDKDISIEEGKLSKIYAGLLYLWLDNQNSSIDIENLEYWCKKDFVSFIMILDIIELRHINFNRLSLKNGMLEVLSDRWSMSSMTEDMEIRSYLDDVLSINIGSNINDRKKLMRRAIRIIFSYPTKYFLDKFLEVHKALAEIDTEESLLCKDSLDKYLSILLRFGYKEDIFEYLLENRRYDEFSMIFCSHELSEKIGTPIESNNRLSLVEKIEAKEELLKDFTVESVYKFHDLSFFSFRRDLELSYKDKITIKTTLSNLASLYKPSKFMGGGRGDNVDIDFLILLASFDSDAFNSINQIFLYESIRQKARPINIGKFDLYMLPNKKLVKFIIQNLDFLIEIEEKGDRDRYIDKLIEIILFSANKEDMLEFFNLIIDRSCSICLSEDTAYYIRNIIGDKLLPLVDSKIKIYHANKTDNPELYKHYITYLYLLEDFKNINLKNWILDKAHGCKENEKLDNFHSNVFINVLPASEYFNKFYKKCSSPINNNFISSWIEEDSFLNEKTVDELMELLPTESIGELLHKNKRYEDITKWGIALFEKHNPMSSIQYLGLKKPLEVFAKNNKELFLYYAVKYLKQVTDIGILFTGGLKDELIKLLMKVDFEKAMELYKSDNRKSLNDHIVLSLFNLEEFCDNKHIKYREAFILNAKSDLEYLQIVVMAFKGQTDNEVLKICKELLESKYATDRLKAISMIMWFATSDEIQTLLNLKLNDNSDYVRKYAQWAVQVALQEKYTREICEEAFYEKDKSVLSAKLYQIRNSLTPTFNYWAVELIEKCRHSDRVELDKVYIQRFLNRTKEKRKITDKFEIRSRKLVEYYCGEKIDNDFKYILGMD